MVSLTEFIRRSVFRAMHAKLLVWRTAAFVHDSLPRCVVHAACQPFQDFYGERKFLGCVIRRITLTLANSPAR